jgi:hypothetical protein
VLIDIDVGGEASQDTALANAAAFFLSVVEPKWCRTSLWANSKTWG